MHLTTLSSTSASVRWCDHTPRPLPGPTSPVTPALPCHTLGNGHTLTRLAHPAQTAAARRRPSKKDRGAPTPVSLKPGGARRPQPPARPTTPSNGARVQDKPRAGGRLPIKLKSRHRGVVVRDLKGRERAVRGGAEPPPGLKKCSRARQGGRGERHCLLITGYRGVGGTFVNGHRRLYRTHPGPGGLEVHNRALFPMHSSSKA